MLHLTISGDVFLKSRRTQRGLVHRVLANARRAIGGDVRFERLGEHRFAVDLDDAAAIDRLTRVFGLSAVDTVVEESADDVEALAAAVARWNADRVTGRTFAVRVKRTGFHRWSSQELAAAAGARLVEAGGRVDLSNPEEVVFVRVIDDAAYVVTEHRKGAAGLPLGASGRLLGLVSGGFDSIVALWTTMGRGAEPEFVHFTLNCAQSEHALAVSYALWERWGFGTDPLVHVVDFQPVKEALVREVAPRMRQVTLKVLMAKAAEQIADDRGIPALVTGDALGQVSSQTLPHLVAVSRAVEIPIFRPLVGMGKEQIVDLARRVGTAEISARAREVCDLAEGSTVATGAKLEAVRAAADRVPEELTADAVATAKTFRLADWVPGS